MRNLLNTMEVRLLLIVLIVITYIGLLVIVPIPINKSTSDDTNINNEITNVLFFGDDYSSYRLDVKGEMVRLTYTFLNYEPIVYYGNFIDCKLIVDGCDYCYKFENTACDGCQLRWELCVYNVETDSYECYSYNDSNSNCVVMDLY